MVFKVAAWVISGSYRVPGSLPCVQEVYMLSNLFVFLPLIHFFFYYSRGLSQEPRRVEGKLCFLPDTGNLGNVLSFPWDISKSQLEEMASELKKNVRVSLQCQSFSPCFLIVKVREML